MPNGAICSFAVEVGSADGRVIARRYPSSALSRGAEALRLPTFRWPSGSAVGRHINAGVRPYLQKIRYGVSDICLECKRQTACRNIAAGAVMTPKSGQLADTPPCRNQEMLRPWPEPTVAKAGSRTTETSHPANPEKDRPACHWRPRARH